ncbi:MAG: hypothetical protein EPO21_03620 [Chloroflexota bacterium]|nr:MAG: hypothetical protein EPO21_03620 [Chloroflexota bacterium]
MDPKQVVDSPILAVKFVPEMRRNVIHRGRLCTSLAAALQEGKVALIVAAAGYGKSTLLSSFVESYGKPSIWYRVDKADADPVMLLTRLLEAVLRRGPSAKALPEDRRGHGPEQWRVILNVLLTALGYDQARELVVILDDFEHIGQSPQTSACLEAMLSYLPPNVRLCIASRAEPRIAHILRLRQYGDLLQLGERDLAFSAEEIQEFFARHHGISIDAQQLSQLTQRTSGWPAVLPMIGQQIMARGTSGAPMVVDLGDANRSLYEYFAHCIVDGQPAAVQEFLERSSVLQQLTPRACDAVLETKNSWGILELLHQNRIFVSVVSDTDEVYVYHSLFREFLQARLRRRSGQAELVALHRAAERYFAGVGLTESALYHACEAGDWAGAAELIREGAPALIRSGHFETVLRWIGMLPGTSIESDPWLLLYKGQVLRFQEQLGPARQALLRASVVAGTLPERALQARLQYELGTLSYVAHQYQEGDVQLQAALALAIEGNEMALAAKAWAGLTVNYTAQDRFQEAVCAAEQALACTPFIADEATRSHSELRAIRHLSWAYLQSGEIEKAIETTQRMYRPLGSDTHKNLGQASLLCVLAAAQAAKGELDIALEHVSTAVDLAEKNSSPTIGNAAIQVKSLTLAFLGRLDQAEDAYRAADEPLRQVADLAYLRLLQGRLDDAAVIARRQLFQAESSSARSETARLSALLGAVEMQRGDLPAADRLLTRAAEQFAQLKLRYHAMGVDLHLAQLHFLSGDTDAGSQLLEKVLTYAEEEGLFNFFLWHPGIVAMLCTEALRRGLRPRYVQQLCQRRLDSTQQSALLPLFGSKGLPVRAQAGQPMPTAMGNPGRTGTDLSAMLGDCKDSEVKGRILDALMRARITPKGLDRLRGHYGLTWRETDIFIQYYLVHQDGLNEVAEATPRREQLARNLFLTDNTLRLHISSIRKKIGILGVRDGLAIFRWAVGEGIVSHAG